MNDEQTLSHLTNLAQELYEEGYMCGIKGSNSDAWFAAWAEAMRRVAGGTPYTGKLVIEIFKESHPGF